MIRPVAIAALFVLVRIAIAASRDSNYDELFVLWMARRPFPEILPSLLHDAGPPLYYFVARVPSVLAGRVFSFAFAAVPLLLLFRQRRWLAATLLAVHPAAAIYAVTARPYAMCAAFLAAGILLLRPPGPPRPATRGELAGAAASFLVAAYTHYAAAFFLPALLFARASWRARFVTASLTAIAFLPGVWFALQQPRAVTNWMSPPSFRGVLNALTFTGDDPRHATWILIAALVLTIVAASRSWAHAPFVLVPLALCVGVSMVRPVFFPIRFASLLAFPLVLWIADSLEAWGRTARVVLVTALIATGCGSITAGIVRHLTRGTGLYRLAAIALEQHVPPGVPIVATGFLYLESISRVGEARVSAFPPEQALQPGWRLPPRRDVSTASLPAGPFVWIGERNAPELDAIRRTRATTLLYQNPRASIMEVR